MANLIPNLSASPLWASVGDAFSWITVDNDIPRQLYAQAVYNVNNGNNYTKVSDGGAKNTLGHILTANLIRKSLYIRNHSSDSMFIKFGLGCTDSDFHIVLKGTDSITDTFGETFTDVSVYQGDVSVFYVDSGAALYSMWEGF
jgi:hypothetical protein